MGAHHRRMEVIGATRDESRFKDRRSRNRDANLSECRSPSIGWLNELGRKPANGLDYTNTGNGPKENDSQ